MDLFRDIGKLTDEDLALLPYYARAYQCKCDEKFQKNSKLSVNPPFIRFPHDDPSQHQFEITIWNKSTKFVQLTILQPNTNIFQVYCKKTGIYGGAQIKLIIRCTPHERKMCLDCLRLKVNGDEDDEMISVPLELFPGVLWFVLPRLIVMPQVEIGTGMEAVISLPQPEKSENFFISVKSSYTDALSVTPFNGVVGGINGIKELIVQYTPSEYTTIVYHLQVHFPDVDAVPHDVIILARKIPGYESENIMQETAEIARCGHPIPINQKFPEPRMVLRPLLDLLPVGKVQLAENVDVKEDLCTQAGTNHFLLKKDDNLYDSTKVIGPLGLNTWQERQIYLAKEQEFNQQLIRVRIWEKSMRIQNHLTVLGEDPLDEESEIRAAIIKERDQHREVYEKALSLSQNDVEDFTSRNVKVWNQRSLRKLEDHHDPVNPILEPTKTEEILPEEITESDDHWNGLEEHDSPEKHELGPGPLSENPINLKKQGNISKKNKNSGNNDLLDGVKRKSTKKTRTKSLFKNKDDSHPVDRDLKPAKLSGDQSQTGTVTD